MVLVENYHFQEYFLGGFSIYKGITFKKKMAQEIFTNFSYLGATWKDYYITCDNMITILCLF